MSLANTCRKDMPGREEQVYCPLQGAGWAPVWVSKKAEVVRMQVKTVGGDEVRQAVEVV